jgi:hypothetical protein
MKWTIDLVADSMMLIVHSGANEKFSGQIFLISEHDILDKSMLKNSNLQTVFDFIEPFKSYDDSKNRSLHKIKLSIFFSFSYISAKTKQSKLKLAGYFSL